MYCGMYVYVSGSVSCLYHTVFDIFYDDKYQYSDDTYHNTYQYCRQYLPIHDLIHTKTAHNTYQYVPITYQYYQQYIPIPTKLHTNTINNTYQYLPNYIPILSTIHTNTNQLIHTNTDRIFSIRANTSPPHPPPIVASFRYSGVSGVAGAAPP